jgi:filamentous hemagglutinin
MNGCPVPVRLALRTHSDLWPKTFFGYSYQPGDLFDRIVEAFADPHDLIEGQITGLYDGQGDIRRGMSPAE